MFHKYKLVVGKASFSLVPTLIGRFDLHAAKAEKI